MCVSVAAFPAAKGCQLAGLFFLRLYLGFPFYGLMGQHLLAELATWLLGDGCCWLHFSPTGFPVFFFVGQFFSGDFFWLL